MVSLGNSPPSLCHQPQMQTGHLSVPTVVEERGKKMLWNSSRIRKQTSRITDRCKPILGPQCDIFICPSSPIRGLSVRFRCRIRAGFGFLWLRRCPFKDPQGGSLKPGSVLTKELRALPDWQLSSGPAWVKHKNMQYGLTFILKTNWSRWSGVLWLERTGSRREMLEQRCRDVITLSFVWPWTY